MNKKTAFILWFDQLSIDDVKYVGGKNASLGEMYVNLGDKGVAIPNGFTITAHAYHYLLEKTRIKKEIKKILSDLNTHDVKNLKERGKKVRELIKKIEFPEELKNAITEAYHHLQLQYGKNVDVAVRSSATAEDLPDASFAGQQDTYLNIRGNKQLLEACSKCFASLFTNRAISYREDKGFNHLSIGLSIGIQKMIRSDKASSGVIFTLDTESGFENVVLINAIYGLGENIVQGKVNPDEYYVFKPTMKQGFKAIISKKIGDKKLRMVYTKGRETTKNVKVNRNERERFVLSDNEILKLAEWATIIEEHYSEKAGHYKPMDIEWAKDGITKQLFIVQARPETVHSQKDKSRLENYVLKGKGKILAKGTSVGNKIGNGKVKIIKTAKDISKFRKNEVLVTEMTDPDWEPIMKIASAIVTERGGRTCHAAIISRELGVPCIVGVADAMKISRNVSAITVDSSKGEVGYIYKGKVPFKIETLDLKKIPETRTQIMMNLGTPDTAFEQSFIPNKGVGLAREEFIINSYIGIHPNALLNFKQLKDKKLKYKIENMTLGFKDKTKFFVDKLAEGVAKIGAAFYPKDVIVRLSDFKSNEYANLVGGKLYEPKEENPMLGWRGASRYYHKDYKEAFALECKALKKVREEFGLTNVKIMIPFCRTVEEGKKVLAEMEKHGLKRGQNNLEVYVMCEIPSNVILADQFAEIFDGFSIGSNDLTQLTLGLDRDSELVASIYDERNEAVKRLIEQVIKTAKEKGIKIGICGQAPSDYEDFATFLVEQGIDSISLNPDTVVKTTLKIAEKEKELGIK